MRTFCNILINVPEETEQELRKTLQLLDEIKPSVSSFNIFIPYVGTEIYENQNMNLHPDEYSLLGKPPLELVSNPRFRFAKHDIDFKDFYLLNHKKYNSLFTFILRYYFSTYYFKQLFRSRRKGEYLFQLKNLIKEYLKQMHI